MKAVAFLSIVIILLCCSHPNYDDQQIRIEIEKGNFTQASHLIDSVIALSTTPTADKEMLLFTKDSL